MIFRLTEIVFLPSPVIDFMKPEKITSCPGQHIHYRFDPALLNIDMARRNGDSPEPHTLLFVFENRKCPSEINLLQIPVFRQGDPTR